MALAKRRNALPAVIMLPLEGQEYCMRMAYHRFNMRRLRQIKFGKAASRAPDVRRPTSHAKLGFLIAIKTTGCGSRIKQEHSAYTGSIDR
jgi:hypothetical protein